MTQDAVIISGVTLLSNLFIEMSYLGRGYRYAGGGQDLSPLVEAYVAPNLIGRHPTPKCHHRHAAQVRAEHQMFENMLL